MKNKDRLKTDLSFQTTFCLEFSQKTTVAWALPTKTTTKPIFKKFKKNLPIVIPAQVGIRALAFRNDFKAAITLNLRIPACAGMTTIG